MSTCILIEPTPEGFFIAADGKSRREDNGVLRVHSLREQKIFQLGSGEICFAFALSGTSRFTPDDDDAEIIFDFAVEVQRISEQLGPTVNGPDYFKRLITLVTNSLERAVEGARADGKRVNYPNNPDQGPGHMIAILFFCGFHSGQPHHIAFRFFHEDQRLQKPSPILAFGVGSQKVSERLSSDPAFARFRQPMGATFLEQAKNYVAACESPEGLEADPDICPGIGGHVHCAQITRSRGFEWVQPPWEVIQDFGFNVFLCNRTGGMP